MIREQKLIDICFEIAMRMHRNKYFEDITRKELAEWVAKQLNTCGFNTKPMGMSWGVLVDENGVKFD